MVDVCLGVGVSDNLDWSVTELANIARTISTTSTKPRLGHNLFLNLMVSPTTSSPPSCATIGIWSTLFLDLEQVTNLNSPIELHLMQCQFWYLICQYWVLRNNNTV